MCTTDVHTYVYPDGHSKEVRYEDRCANFHNGWACARNTIKHPAEYAKVANQMPPSPAYTPRSVTPSYRSEDDSDRSGSRHSNSSRKSRSPRTSGVYVNGKMVFDLGSSHPRRTSSTRGERVVLVDTPPTPRTPPQSFPGSASVPNSPSQPFTETREYHPSRRPVIVDERTRTEPHLSPRRHSRHPSTSSHEGRHSDEERERRRRRKEQESREAIINERIAKANAKINARSAVPQAPTPPPRRESTFDTTTTGATAGSDSSTTTSPKTGYTRPRVELHSQSETARRLSFEEEFYEKNAFKQAEKDKRREEEAQRRRLMERMQPKRRASVGPGSRRERERYEEGVFRWE